jgi:chemotaxis protein MotB
MSDDKIKHTIIKRIKKVSNKHHGGQWKIAYADFVTAMMAFFLLMWLLALLNKYQRDGIAEYFKKPLKEAFTQQQPQKKTSYVKVLNKKQELLQTTKTLSQLQELKKSFEEKVNRDPVMKQYKNQLNFVITSDGLKIELKDLENKPMFSEGDTDFKAHAKLILAWLGNQLNTYPNNIVIIGHTDSVPYAGEENYSNWELSADRANATRRALIDNGMDDQKILRIMGSSDRELLVKNNGLDASNRRIEIVVLTDEAAKKILEE